VTPAGELLRAEIRAGGPLRFSRFMEVALYHPDCGYYTRGVDPFGKHGDFFTAAQCQPVFGRLIASSIRGLFAKRGADPGVVFDWGAGRGEMREAFEGLEYRPVDALTLSVEAVPMGAIFANELFDALPVDVARRKGSGFVQRRVDCADDSFQWVDAEELGTEWLGYAEALSSLAPKESGIEFEVPVRHADALERMSAACANGFLLVIDYGWRGREIVRFPQGTLMSYRRHLSVVDVLASPGMQDITSHVPFDWLSTEAARLGWKERSFTTMQRFLLDVGEVDAFAAALSASSRSDELRLQMQLKTLLFGMGETFRVMLMER
jgi:SAM-dependent MidA family methyltransferase